MIIQVGGRSIDVRPHPEFNCYAADRLGGLYCRPALRPKGMPRSGPRPRSDYWVDVSQFIVEAKGMPAYKKFRATQDGKTRVTTAHRFILECWQGVMPPQIVTRHLDGDPVNNKLENLKYGTTQENVDDSFMHHGNYAEGSRNGRAKLSETDVINIRSRYGSGEKLKDISRDYINSTHASIWQAATRRTWGHIP